MIFENSLKIAGVFSSHSSYFEAKRLLYFITELLMLLQIMYGNVDR